MTLIGKILGFLLGFMILGPIGGVIGLLIGALFDQGLKLHLHHIPSQHSEAIQRAFFKATFSVMGHLAKADGRISEKEIEVAKTIMDRLELTPEFRKEAIRLFNEGKENHFELHSVLEDLYQACKNQRDVLRFFIEIQVESALADGELHPEEQSLLLVICEQLHFSPHEFQQLWARMWAEQAFYQWYRQFEAGSFNQGTAWHSGRSYTYGSQKQRPETVSRNTLNDAYGVLGVPAHSTPAEIKKAYRKLMNQHHPDKLASRGLPDTMLKLAKEKTQQIRAAYDLIRENRGFR